MKQFYKNANGVVYHLNAYSGQALIQVPLKEAYDAYISNDNRYRFSSSAEREIKQLKTVLKGL